MAACVELDETMCQMLVCPHPQCWVSFRRIEKGHPHVRATGTIRRLSTEGKGALPALKVTNLPNLQPPPVGLDDHYLRVCSSIGRLGQLPSAALCDLSNKTSKSSLHKMFFPGLNSSAESEASPRKCNRCSSPTKQQRAEVMDVSVASVFSHGTESKRGHLVWIPSSQGKHQQQHKMDEREEALKVGIKDLTFQSLHSKDVRSEAPDTALLKSSSDKRVLTGGGAHNLTPSFREDQKSQRTTARFTKERSQDLPKGKRRFCVRSLNRNRVYSPDPLTPLLENKRVVLHDTKERHQAAAPGTGPVYKLDDQHCPHKMEVDLNSIRKQCYLWKKYIGAASPGGTVRASDHQPLREPKSQLKQIKVFLGDFRLFPSEPPQPEHGYYRQHGHDLSRGSVSGNTGRSESVSLASLTQGSWTRLPECPGQESYQKSAGTDSSREARWEDLEEQAEGFENPELGEDLAEQDQSFPAQQQTLSGERTPSALQQELLTANVGEDSGGPSASAPESAPSTEDVSQSPQPAPPPPSPIH